MRYRPVSRKSFCPPFDAVYIVPPIHSYCDLRVSHDPCFPLFFPDYPSIRTFSSEKRIVNFNLVFCVFILNLMRMRTCTCMGHSFCAEKTGFGISEFLSFCDVAFCTTFRGHSDMDSNNINVTWCSLFSSLRKVMGDGW